MHTPTIETSLFAISEAIKKSGYEVLLQPPNELSPSEQLFVQIGKSSEGNPIFLQFFWAAEIENSSPSAKQVAFLQCLVILPFVALEGNMRDLTTLIFNLNAALDMASFGLYESERIVYYRHSHVCSSPKMELEPLLAVFASIEFLFQSTYKALEDVALGRKSLAQIQAEVKRTMEMSK